MTKHAIRVLSLLTYLGAAMMPVSAQNVNATVRGVVRDPSGAVITGIVNNQIPQSQIVPQAVKILSYYPLPNLTAATGSLNYVNSTPSRTPQDQFSLRADHVISERNNVSVSYQFFDYFVYTPSTVPGFSTEDKQRSQQAVIKGHPHLQSRPSTATA